MNWKQTLFLGGAILLLAACGDATAPTPQLREGGSPAAAAIGSNPSFSPTSTTECRSSYNVSSGRYECEEF